MRTEIDTTWFGFHVTTSGRYPQPFDLLRLLELLLLLLLMQARLNGREMHDH